MQECLRRGGLLDGTWLFRTNGAWQPIAELNSVVADGRARRVAFAYVAREPELKNTRRGVLIIKMGVDGPNARNGDRVTLRRDAYRAAERCESYPNFERGSVRSRSYDLYHDYSYRVESTDQRTIESFHVSYAGRIRGCRRSNDDTPDSYFSGRRQSNRSQFSFDERVVADGQYSQFLAQFGSIPAVAATPSERRVEMKQYVADESGLACVLFRSVVKPGMFIRINDLERRSGWFRAPEQSWSWPRR